MLISTLGLTGCSQSGITQEKYDQVASERDDYKEKYEELLNDTAERNVDKMLNDMTEAEETELKTSENSTQESQINDTEELLSDSEIILKSGEYVVGKDLEPGEYDVYRKSGKGIIKIKESQEAEYSEILNEFIDDTIDNIYNNLSLKNSNYIQIKTGLEIKLIKK